MRKVLFLTPYPSGEAPSQRFRFEQYFGILQQHGFSFHEQSFFDLKSWRILYAQGNRLKKAFALFAGFWRRIKILFYLGPYDFVFIHREAAPFGPPLLEWVIAKVLRKKVIYDFDDAIWQTDKTNEPILEKWLRHRSKVGTICRWSHRVSTGNRYLQAYALQFNTEAYLNPTTLDTQHQHNPAQYSVQKSAGRIVIGWTGSHSTLKYLTRLDSVLRTLEENFPHLDILVIADQRPALSVQRLRFLPWSKATEVSDLMIADIGIMPLPNDPWALGKGGFKALQYMALEIPAVISPVGINTEIIQDGKNGFLCDSDEEWRKTLERLINDAALRKGIGEAGRKTVVNHFSTQSNASNFLSLFQ